jgi:hypothetical protein
MACPGDTLDLVAVADTHNEAVAVGLKALSHALISERSSANRSQSKDALRRTVTP